MPAVIAPLIGSALGAAFPGMAAISIAGTALTTIGGQLLAGVALTALSRAMGNRAQAGQQIGIATQRTTAGDTVCQTVMLGLYATAGNKVCPDMVGGHSGKTPNAYLTYVHDISDTSVDGLEAVWIDDEKAPLGDPLPVGGIYPGHRPVAAGKYKDRAWFQFWDGRQTSAAPGLTTINDPDRPWTADMVGRGVAYVICRFKADQKVFKGLPTVLFEVRGVRLYDPRKDTTVGGAGAHRWSDVGTWTYTVNPAVMVYNILRGITLPDGDRWGGAAEAEDLPLANWFAAMNECDRLVEGAAQYRAGYEAKVGPEELGGQAPASVIEELLKSCSGVLAETGGIWRIRCGPPGPPVAVLTDEDIIVSEEQSFDPFEGLQSIHNAVQVQYPEPGERWVNKDAPPRRSAVFEAQDGGFRKVASLQLPACPYPDQAQRLSLSLLNDGRRQRRHAITLPPDYEAVDVLDTVAWTSARNGYQSKLFEVGAGSSGLRTLLHRVDLREVDPSDYDWWSTDLLPSPVAPVQVSPPVAGVLPGWRVEATAVQDSAGRARRVALRLSWEPDIPDARGVAYEVRVAGQVSLAASGSVQQVEDGGVTITEGVIPATDMQARGRLIAARETLWTDWVTVRTGAAPVAREDLSKEVRDDLASLEKWAADTPGLIDQVRSDLAVDYHAALDAAGQANAARDAAQAARDAALGAKSGATTAQAAAQAARDLADQAAKAASTSSNSAAGSASTADTKAKDADISAKAAAASVVQANTGAARVLPAEVTSDYWRQAWSGAPGSSGLHSAVTVSGGFARFPMGGTENLVALSQTTLPLIPGRIYRVTVAARANESVQPDRLRLLVAGLDENRNYVRSLVTSGSFALPQVGEMTVSSREYTMAASAGVTQVRIGVWMQVGTTGSIDLETILIDDVTALKSSEAAASASASSASGADASKTAAGQFATAAKEDATKAATARGGAEAARDLSSASETSAKGAAAAAKVSEVAAAGSATLSGQKADASAGSASLASTKATEAEQQAKAAQAEATKATTARGEAEAARDLATAAKTDAAGSAAAAKNSELASAGSATLSGQKATAAAGSATAAGTSATDAAREAAAANTAKVAAETAKGVSQIARDDAVLARDDARGSATAAAASLSITSRLNSASGVINDQYLSDPAWTVHMGQGTLIKRANEIYPIGQTWQWNLTETQENGVYATSANGAFWPGQTNAPGYVVEVEFTRINGSLSGAGVVVRWANTDGQVFITKKTLPEMDPGFGLSGRSQVARGVFKRSPGYSGAFAEMLVAFYANNGQNLFGPMVAKQIKVHRISIRVASEEEMGGGAVAEAVQATLNQSYLTKAETNSAISSSLTQYDAGITTKLNAKAAASTVQAIDNRVTQTEQGLSATSNSLTQVSARTDRGTASGLLRVTAESKPSGVQTRLGARVAASADGVESAAAFYMDARAGGKSEIIWIADRVAIVSGEGPTANRSVPFIVQDGRVYMDAAIIREGDITNAKIGNEIRSNDFVSGENGQGWRILKSGAAEFNDVTIRRQIEVASGTVNVGTFNPRTQYLIDTSSGGNTTSQHMFGEWVNLANGPGAVVSVMTTPVPISAWLGAKKTYLANVGMTGTVTSGNSANAYWGWTADVLPLTKWSGDQSLRLRLCFWSQAVAQVKDCVLTWKIYEVS